MFYYFYRLILSRCVCQLLIKFMMTAMSSLCDFKLHVRDSAAQRLLSNRVAGELSDPVKPSHDIILSNQQILVYTLSEFSHKLSSSRFTLFSVRNAHYTHSTWTSLCC